ncbi:MAG: tRNA threonylcarbamoyladenosine biosynthesis protein TsaE [Anaerolineales bacterium]|nr:tRNA threonylcarbamoyladenosine biosynthesis protein TsaE [Anaerolineales bacterium]
MTVLDIHSLDFISRSPEQTRRIGIRLGGLLKAGDLICLQGNLGAGKTTFVQGMAQGWGAFDSVSSPTFVLVNVYRRAGGGQIFHMDAYRIQSAPEAQELDLGSMQGEGPVLIEWADRIEGVLPFDRLWVNFEHVADEQRDLRFRAVGRRHDEILSSLRHSMFGVE